MPVGGIFWEGFNIGFKNFFLPWEQVDHVKLVRSLAEIGLKFISTGLQAAISGYVLCLGVHVYL